MAVDVTPPRKMQPTDPPARALSVRGTRVSITEDGPADGPVLLMLPGVPGGHLDFRYLAPAIALAGVRAIRLELPGFGSNLDAPKIRDYSSRGRGRLVVGTADALDLPRFSILGHSMGGSAVLAVAAENPERIASLTLLASTGVSRHKGIPAPPPVVRAFVTVARLPFLWPRFVARIRKAYKAFRFAGAETMTEAEILIHARCVWSQSFGENRRHAARVTCPTLVAFADDDRMIEPAIGQELAAAIRTGPRVLRFDTGGHAIQKSRSTELATAIAELVLSAAG